MPVRSRLGAGGAAGAGPPARPGGACGKPALFHLLFWANVIVDNNEITARISIEPRFMCQPLRVLRYLRDLRVLEIELGSDPQQASAEDLDGVLPRLTVRHVRTRTKP